MVTKTVLYNLHILIGGAHRVTSFIIIITYSLLQAYTRNEIHLTTDLL